jgi:hypothetical protein
MPSKSRPDPVIPDHEILRKIGGGAYGEVWLGRGVTGALRAVKVVWREDFDDARGFEREFEGILKFEPISRDHPGLVQVLHVGRSQDGVTFYYYVMELGDDVRSGQDINPIEYEPRTLRADTKQAVNPMWPMGECIDVGLRLAEALDHLHERGLAHRDVKPSNVIFLNGRAKLADIGLVAARDQRTFVGTEGFVPPEGPGSAQADVYSLGKVLYEIATGKDRLDFPELPDVLPSGGDRKRWLELNKIICDICEPRLSKRTITTAGQLAEELRRLQRGKRRRRRSGTAVWMTTLVLMGFAGWAGYEVLKSGDWQMPWKRSTAPVVAKMGTVKVGSSPEGADVFDGEGRFVGITPTRVIEAKVGERVKFSIRKTGYRSETVEDTVSSSEELLYLQRQLKIFAPPEPAQTWEDHLGNFYQPVRDDHVSVGYVTETAWRKFIEVSKRSAGSVEFLDFSQNGQPVKIALATQEEAVAFCDWLRVGGYQQGYLTEDHEVLPSYDVSFQNPAMSEKARSQGLRPFRVIVRQIDYGMIRLVTNPPGAEVYINGIARGLANSSHPIEKVKPGRVDLLLVLEGYKPKPVTATVVAGQPLSLDEKLEPNQGVIFGKEWQNGIEMKFVPMGQDLMVSAWETRVVDYERFVKETGHVPARRPEFAQEANSPVVFVSREDAMAFCVWLTDFERRNERIAPGHEYRLPTDMEWSQMAGLVEEEGLGPGWREARKLKNFPWGDEWPPEPRAGNFADSTAALAPGMSSARTIANYNDGFPYTSPVGSFPPNPLGIYDLSGNVQEWVQDDYSGLGDNPLGVLRGGGWSSYQEDSLYTGTRNFQPATFTDNMYGFRVVLWKVPPRKSPTGETMPLPALSDPQQAPTPTIPPTDG